MARKPKSWFERQARRARLSVAKMSRQIRASELKIQTELPERGDQERETSSFWFRRVTTAILLGNGGGIVALSSYLANASDKPGVAVLAYPALTNFFSGALLGFASYTISLMTASLRFDSHMKVFISAVEVAKKSGKTASTQYDEVFAFLIMLAILQAVFLAGAGASFYNGSSYILSAIGREACRDSRESFCIGSPLIFPFVSPRPELTSAQNAASKAVVPSDFTVVAAPSDDGTVSRIFISPPRNHTVTELTTSTTVQIVAPSGDLCLFSTPYFADGGLELIRPTSISDLKDRLERRGYSFTPVSSRVFISSSTDDENGKLTLVNIMYSYNAVSMVSTYRDADLSVLPFPYGDAKGLVLVHEDADRKAVSRCLDMAEDAGLLLGERRHRAPVSQSPQ